MRVHREDIPVLADHFICKHRSYCNPEIQGISAEGVHALTEYSYPGNVRELENIIQRAMIFAMPPLIKTHDLPKFVTGDLGIPWDGRDEGR